MRALTLCLGGGIVAAITCVSAYGGSGPMVVELPPGAPAAIRYTPFDLAMPAFGGPYSYSGQARPAAPRKSLCFWGDADPQTQAALEARYHQGAEKFQFVQRWTTTATNGGGLGQGDRTILTYSFAPDGITKIPGDPDLANGDQFSNLFSTFDALYGDTATWQDLFHQVFARWSEVTGINYVFETNDDGATFPGPTAGASGVLNVRGDVRIGGYTIDGPGSGILAFNFFPNVGDMVIDTGNAADFFANFSGNSLGFRNTISHEHGHGLGIAHVCPVNETKLMEPFISFNFDGPKLDDILVAQKFYGDRNAGNTSFSDAADLGTLNIETVTAADMSLAGNFEEDFYSFTISAARGITVTLTPTGATYLQGPQTGNCDTGATFNSLNQMNLEVQLLATDGISVLDTADITAAGSAEALTQDVFAAGTYFVRVFTDDANNNIQAYDLSVEAEAAGQGAPTVRFETGAFTVAETGNTGIVTVVLSGPAGAPVTVNFASSNGTATAGSDYTAVSGIMEFGPAETEKTISVAVSDDLNDEGDETVLMTLEGPSEGLLPGEPLTATLTITDNDTTAVASLSATSFPVNEGAGTLTIAVNLSPAPGAAVAIDFTIVAGTATLGEDIVGTTGTLQISAGETTKLFGISIVDDELIEGSEMATISLMNPTSGIELGSPVSATISIEENDFESITTVIASPPDTSFSDQPVTFSATVTPIPEDGIGFVPTGMVTFRDSALFLGTRTLNSGGVATLTTSSLIAGSHTITAEYLGGGVFLGTPMPFPSIVHVVEENRPPVFDSGPVVAAAPGAEYVYPIEASDPDPSDTLSITVPVIPPWMGPFVDNGDGTATLRGTPGVLDVGDHDVVLRANDGNGGTVDQSFTIVVTSDNDAPEIVSEAVTAGIAGEEYSYSIVAEDPDVGDVLTIDAIQLPGWLMLTDHGDGTADLIGTPQEADVGNEGVEIRVRDALGASDTQSFTIVVLGAGGNHAPTAIALSNNRILPGDPVGTEIGVFTTTDLDTDDTHTYSLVTGPGDDNNGLFTIDGDALEMAAALGASDDDLSIRVRTEDGNGGAFTRAVELLVTRTPLELCDLLADAENEYEGFKDDLQLASRDFDTDFVPDLTTLALMERVACVGSASSLATAAANAYTINLELLDTEPGASSMADRFGLFAALMSISADMQDSLADILADEGIVLVNAYTAVRCDSPGDCEPQLGKTEYTTFEGGAKAANEPFSGAGDLDGDGLANIEEFNNVAFSGGDASDFLDAAINPLADGTIPEEDLTAGCAAGGGMYSTGGLGEFLGMCLVLAAVFAATGRRPSVRRARLRRTGVNS